MTRIKIDYGIDLGTTNSVISRIENGEPVIKKTDTLKDTMPSCVSINKKKAFRVGDSAYEVLKRDKLSSMKNNENTSNVFIEFKRTMGTDKKYVSSHLNRDMSSEELSAEVLKTLKSFITDENVNAVVITVPAAFKNNQIDATRRAASFAGFTHVEILQEPVAAAMAYGLDSKKKNGFWLVFDFGGGTFDAALLKVDDGIMKVIDTEGDNYLGGKNLDLAIVDEIILPHIRDNYKIEALLKNDSRKQALRNAMKYYAEETKIKLSFNSTHYVLSDLGDISGTDDDGEEFELDITVTQNDMERALSPVFQKAIDLSKKLLERNNLKASSLDSLILVGGPTYSPVLRKMLEEQICKPDTSIDPMTVVSKGAALYASTVEISENIKEQTRDRTKIQLEIGHEASTVELEEYVTIKTLPNETEEIIPRKIFAEVVRNDKAWSSGKVQIDERGEVIDIQLIEGRTNSFTVILYDEKGNILENEPKEFTVIQGAKIGNATLPYNFGIEIRQIMTNKIIFSTVPGLEKNKSLPAIGVMNGLKTPKQIRPGVESDFIKIPLYQGGYEANDTRAIYNEHIYDVIISGADLPALLPANSDVDLTVSINRSQELTIQAYFPYIDYTTEIKVPTDTVQTVDTNKLAGEIQEAKKSIQDLKKNGNTSTELLNIESQINELERKFNNNKHDVDNKQEVLTNLRNCLKSIDIFNKAMEWPTLEKELKTQFYRLEKANSELGNEQSTQAVRQIRNQIEETIKQKDVRLGNVLLEEIDGLYFQLTLIYQLIGYIRHYDTKFSSYNWSDRNGARKLLNQGLQKIGENPMVDELRPIVISLLDLLPEGEGSDILERWS